VLVQGMCAEITDEQRLDALRDLPLAPWNDGSGLHVFMGIPTDEVIGEEVRW